MNDVTRTSKELAIALKMLRNPEGEPWVLLRESDAQVLSAEIERLDDLWHLASEFARKCVQAVGRDPNVETVNLFELADQVVGCIEQYKHEAERTTPEPPADQLPSAWIKGHTMHTDCGLEYDEEVVPGSDSPPGDGWHPLYSRPAECPACPEFVRMQKELCELIGASTETDSLSLHDSIKARLTQPPADDAARLNWWFMNVLHVGGDEDDDEAGSEIEYEARLCRTPNEFRAMIDAAMGSAPTKCEGQS